MTSNDESESRSEREQALQRLKKQRDFQSHLVAFLVVNAALWGVWFATSGGYPWPAWFTGTWAIGLALNAWEVYFRRPITESDVERELRRLRSAH